MQCPACGYDPGPPDGDQTCPACSAELTRWPDPDDVERAADFWSSFTWGRNPDRAGRLAPMEGPHLPLGAPPVLVHLGRLVGFELARSGWWAPDGRVVVTCDPDGRRAYLAGGPVTLPEMVWGQTIDAIHYRVQKGDEPLATWRHEFEPRRPRLSLLPSVHDGRPWPVIAGGGYYIHPVYGFVE